MLRPLFIGLFGVALWAEPAFAQVPNLEAFVLIDLTRHLPAATATAPSGPPVDYFVVVRAQRPKLLLPLYASYVALQVLDVFSTARALDVGKRELNPLFRDGNTVLMIGAKAAATTGLIFVTERLWKRNDRKLALTVMIASNVFATWVVSNNFNLAY